jgi:LCP family protein required for cell wall assembly
MSNKKIVIWIGIFSIIGVILLVAIKMGIFTQKRQDTFETVNQSSTASGFLPENQNNSQSGNHEEHLKERLLSGKPYSVKLVEKGTKNLLIIGEDKTSDKYDTISIANIDQKNKKLKLIMIPRDTYIEYNNDILARLEELKLANAAGIYKINCAHSIGSRIKYKGRFDSGPISFLAAVIEEKFGIHADDYMKINTKGFSTLINHLGGIDIDVPYDMNYNDPKQDLSIHLKKGRQHLNGSGAEGFVRFRQGHRADGSLVRIGDIERKNNQIYFLKELIKQKGTLQNIGNTRHD